MKFDEILIDINRDKEREKKNMFTYILNEQKEEEEEWRDRREKRRGSGKEENLECF